MKNAPVVPAVTEYLHRKAAAAGVPLSGTFELTPVCNMDCKMCYVRMSQGQQQAVAPLQGAAFWLALAEQAKKEGMLYLLLTGGEPFLREDFRELLHGLHKLGLIITVNSNATLIDEKTVAWLKACPPVRINISLYGASDETYSRLCGNSRGFTQVTRAITLLQEAGIAVKLNCSLTPYNAEDLPAIVAFARERELPLQVGTYMFPPVRKSEALAGQNDRFSPEAAAYYAALADRLILGKERFEAQEAYCPSVSDWEDCGQTGEKLGCRAAKSSFWVTWQGRLTPCGMFPEGGWPKLTETDFTAAWQQVKTRTAELRLPARCAACTAKSSCRACAAMVVAESGSFDKVPAYRCQMMQATKAQWQRVRNLTLEEETL